MYRYILHLTITSLCIVGLQAARIKRYSNSEYDARTIGLAVGIPVGAVILFVLMMWCICSNKNTQDSRPNAGRNGVSTIYRHSTTGGGATFHGGGGFFSGWDGGWGGGCDGAGGGGGGCGGGGDGGGCGGGGGGDGGGGGC